MLYMFLALSSAALLGIGAAGFYGWDALAHQSWVDQAFWALIFAGFILAALDNTSALWCQLCQRLAGRVTLCQRTPCGSTVA